MTYKHLVPVLGLAALALAAPARAQSGGWIDRSRPEYASVERQSYYDSSRAAHDNGYREGLKRGEKDGRENRAFSYRDEKTFQRADNGYHREFGDLERYRQSFRTGYVAGYGAGYQRYAPVAGYGSGPGYGNGRGYGNGPGYGNGRGEGREGRQDSRDAYPDSRNGYPSQYPPGSGYGGAAFQNGAQDGYEKGTEDARKGRSFDVLRHQWYRSGDRHYDRRFGPREQYKNVYRDGFKEGYERGYRDGRYRY